MSLTVKTAVIHGLAWLYEIEQPPGALATHHGIHVRVTEARRTLFFVPRGEHGTPLIVVNVSTRADGGGRPGPLGVGEVEALAQWCTRLRVSVAGTRHGVHEDTGSIELSRVANRSLVEATDRYNAGCPDHDGEFFCGCNWARHGRSLLRIPRMLDRSETTS